MVTYKMFGFQKPMSIVQSLLTFMNPIIMYGLNHTISHNEQTCDIELLIIMIITHSGQLSHRWKWKHRYVISLTIIQWSLKHLRLSHPVWQINNKNLKLHLMNNRLEAFKHSSTLKDMDVSQAIKHAQQSRQFSISRASQHEQQSLQIQPERVLLHVM